MQLVLPDGAALKGEIVVVREDAFVLDVKSTSDAKTYPKGHASVPRTSVNLLQVGGYVAAVTADSAGPGIATFLGIATTGTLGGYYVEKGLDRKVTLIKVIPWDDAGYS